MTAATGDRTTRRYRPRLEALEALKLLDHGLGALMAPEVVEAVPTAVALDRISPETSAEAWDAALDTARVADWLEPDLTSALAVELDPVAVQNGLDQLDRYLGRAWARAGIAPQQFEDCTQSVYVTLLEQLGPIGFSHLAGDVGRHGVRQVLNWESAEGPDFFRAIDMVKKRTQRTRTHVSLDDQALEIGDRDVSGDASERDWNNTLAETMARVLSPREARLIRETLEGKSPAEIANDWGCAPKTVSNEKSRAFQKLREALAPVLAA